MSTKGKRRSSQDSGCVKVHTVRINSMRLTSISVGNKSFERMLLYFTLSAHPIRTPKAIFILKERTGNLTLKPQAGEAGPGASIAIRVA
jgi:hypothetical protein